MATETELTAIFEDYMRKAVDGHPWWTRAKLREVAEDWNVRNGLAPHHFTMQAEPKPMADPHPMKDDVVEAEVVPSRKQEQIVEPPAQPKRMR